MLKRHDKCLSMRRIEAASVNMGAADYQVEYHNHRHRDLSVARRAVLWVLRGLEPRKAEEMLELRYERPVCHQSWREVR